MKKDSHTVAGSDQPLIFPKKLERLILTIQHLSLARDLNAIVDIVRREARVLTGSDGATFVLRDDGKCYYVDEDAIAPLWKGKKFPMENCISGWVMLNHKTAVIEDIYKDKRIPVEAYQPTFVKSLVMVPIRTQAPIGAIGNYWAHQHVPSEIEIKMLEALADSVSVAMENAKLFSDLETKLNEYKSLSGELTASLNEKDVLLKEVYHRVKNNLQVVSSLLNLQTSLVGDEFVKSMLLDSISRINAMSVLHEMLYQSDNKANILLSEYIDKLIKHIYKISEVDINDIQFNTDIDNVVLSIDQAIPCGLIVNELVSNIFKHAYPEGKSGSIFLSIKNADKTVIIRISDFGVGMPENAMKNKKALGLKLVENLTRQLGGLCKINVDKGTTVEISFPKNGI